MNKTIEIVVAPDGNTRVQTRGFVGGECREASRFVEQALGRHIDEQLTPEFHQTASTDQRSREQA
jgi:hypothetical protein